MNFLDYLTENDDDKKKYGKNEFQSRNQVTVTIRKGTYAGMLISEDNMYHRVDFLKLESIKQRIYGKLDLLNIYK